MPVELIALIAVIVLAVTGAIWARTELASPAKALTRLRATAQPASGVFLLPQAGEGLLARWSERIADMLPDGMVSDKLQERLAQAGFRSMSAPTVYVASQLLLALVFMTTMTMLVGDRGLPTLLAGVIAGAGCGVLLPSAVVERMRRHRQYALRRGLPDVLDLLLVCVEAGISLDAAIFRVGRELALAHPQLAEELQILGRWQNAGVPRDEALRAMWLRTGMPEFRTLAANIIQSERWGTSIARVLRVNAEVMRRRRRAHAEKRAALAGTRMLFPLVLLILPALLVVIGGPMLIQIRDIFDALSRG